MARGTKSQKEEGDLRQPLLDESDAPGAPPEQEQHVDGGEQARFSFPSKEEAATGSNGKDKSKRKSKTKSKSKGNDGEGGVAEAPARKGPSFIAILFRFATIFDYLLLAVGGVASAATGCAVPLVSLVFGNLLNVFNEWPGCVALYEAEYDDQSSNPGVLPNSTSAFDAAWKASTFQSGGDLDDGDLSSYLAAYPCPWLNEEQTGVCEVGREADDPRRCIASHFLDRVNAKLWWFAAIGACTLTCGYLSYACFQWSCERQTRAMREAYFKALLTQTAGWYDKREGRSGELSARVASDTEVIQKAIGDKVGRGIQIVATLVCSLTLGFYSDWRLALLLLGAMPLLVSVVGVVFARLAKFASLAQQAYAVAGGVAEETISSIKTVAAFGLEERAEKEYERQLKIATKNNMIQGNFVGVGIGMINMLIYAFYGLAFGFGSWLIHSEGASVGDVTTTFFALITGAFSLGGLGPIAQAAGEAISAAIDIWDVLDGEVTVDVYDDKAGEKRDIVGDIVISKLVFAYPIRPDVQVLRGLSLHAVAGKSVALVGHSGCGKSTVVALLQRLYDATAGSITIDGVEISQFNVQYLRKQMGLVGQEPVLFDATVRENIAFGMPGASDELIELAAKRSNAHNYIMNLPDKYDTKVGEKGAQLSGGQKQRLAIARALIRNPKVLLLDEATSALDTESERIVQEALDKAAMGRTTVIIAHRLSTIQGADSIAVLEQGQVVEQGTYKELLAAKGAFAELVAKQQRYASSADVAGQLEAYEEAMAAGAMDRQMSSPKASGLSRRFSGVLEDEAKAIEDELKKTSVLKVFAYNRPEWKLLVVGCFFAIGNGIKQPVFSIVFSHMLTVLQEQAEPDASTTKAALWSCMFVGIGLGCFVVVFLQISRLEMAGALLTERMRRLSLQAILKQDIGFFDLSSNGVGALGSRLAVDATLLKGLSGGTLGLAIEQVANACGGLLLGFLHNVHLSVAILIFTPIILISSRSQMATIVEKSDTIKNAMQQAGAIVSEALEAVTTVQSLSLERYFLASYRERLELPYKRGRYQALVGGFGYGLGQSFICIAYTVSFWFGSRLIANCDTWWPFHVCSIDKTLGLYTFFATYSALVFPAITAGQIAGLLPDYTKARVAAANIFQLLERAPLISKEGGRMPDVDAVVPKVKFNDVHFRYPQRRDVWVLKGLSFEAPAGKTLALVGHSGCGKSTVMALLQRFYNVERGAISFNGDDIMTLNVPWLRKQMGIVTQEPVLFDGSVAQNIAWGKVDAVFEDDDPSASSSGDSKDGKERITMADIERVAKEANAHNFVSELPEGYRTRVGEKGSQLSGGQKQRIAIARALLRNPKVLLLDEATSALDAESESLVQDALERASEGRTTIVIAHRLSTIQNADSICVLKSGVLKEQGTHSELMQQQGAYFRLVQRQMQAVTM